ncbi:MAG: ABC transporter substrate-binding protein [Bacteroidota bacterium]
MTEETTEFLYALGEERRIVGISAYTCRPAHAKNEKPVVSAFIGGSVQKIKALAPDLVIGFSDVQAELAHDLIKANLQVLITNQRSIAEIIKTLYLFGSLVGAEAKAEELIAGYQAHIQHIRDQVPPGPRPKIYFEEWDDPAISAIEWVSELIEIAGGEPIFADRATGKASKARYVEQAEILERAPDAMIACWCGKALDRASVLNRPGFSELPAIQHQQLYEMDPAIILQPGPACLTDGLTELHRIITQVRSSSPTFQVSR